MCLIAISLLREIPKPQNLFRNSLLYPLPNLNRSFNTSFILQQSSKLSKGTSRTRTKVLKYLGIGFGIGIFASAGPIYNHYKKVNTTTILNSSDGADYFLEEPPPHPKIARSLRIPEDKSGLKITLYQFQTCPFCCKVRSYLDYYGFSYDVVEVNSVTHKETKWTSYRKVPFLVIEQEEVETVMQLKDSTMIISALHSFICNKTANLEDIVKGFPIIQYTEDGSLKTDILNRYSLQYGAPLDSLNRTKEDILSEKKWRKWVDDSYVHMLSPNVYRTMNESFQAFNWFSEVGNWKELFATWERWLVVYVGAVAMYLIGKRLKKKYNLKEDVRASFYEETNVWLKEVRTQGGIYAGGKEPNLSDLAVFGVLTAVEGCDAFNDLMNNTKLQAWYDRMKDAVQTHQGANYLAQRGSNLP